MTAGRMGDAERQHGNAAGAQHGDAIARADRFAPAHQRIPRGYAGAGKRRRFLEGQALRNLHDAALGQRYIFREHAVAARGAERRARRRVRRTVMPVLEEEAGDAVARLELRHAVADRDDFARAVGQRHSVVLQNAAEVIAGDHRLVAIIQRTGAYANEDFSRFHLRLVLFDDDEAFQRGRAGFQDVFFHGARPFCCSGENLRGIINVRRCKIEESRMSSL